MNAIEETLAIVRTYHCGWSHGRFDEAFDTLAETLEVEVPINEYPTKTAFAEAVVRFAGITSKVELLAEFANEREAMLLYDMVVQGLGPFRVAEHFTVANGKITRIRQIHDTAAFRGDRGAKDRPA
jgi:ketosteroid isomerase-like protein